MLSSGITSGGAAHTSLGPTLAAAAALLGTSAGFCRMKSSEGGNMIKRSVSKILLHRVARQQYCN